MPNKLLYVSDALIYGGAERYLLNLIRGLDRSSFKPAVLTATEVPDYLTTQLQQMAVPQVLLPPIIGKRDVGGIYRYATCFAQHKPDIVHLNIANPLNGHYAILAAQIARVPVRIATLHLPPRSTTPTRRGRWLEKQTVCRLQVLIAVCQSSRDLMITHFGIAPDRTAVIYNGIETTDFGRAERSSASKQNGPTRIGTVGRLSAQKGFDVLLEAARMVCNAHPDTHFEIVGEGPDRTVLENQCHRLGLSNNVRFLGARTDVPERLKTFDIFVLPSRYESFPFVILEAMAAGLPIVASRVDGIPEAVSHTETGLLVPSENPDALAKALSTLIDAPNLWEKMGRQAQNRVAAEFSLAQMIQKTESIYHSHLEGIVRPHARIDD